MTRRLADVPPEERGIPWKQYAEQQWKEWVAETGKLREGSEPWISGLAIATPRDRYGWRGLSTGSRMLDRE